MPNPHLPAVPPSGSPALPVVVSPTTTPSLVPDLPALPRRGKPITEPDPTQLLDLRQRLLAACDRQDCEAIVRERALVARMRPSSHWSERAWIDVSLSMAIVEAVCPGTISKKTADAVWTGLFIASTYAEEVQGMGAAAAFALGALGPTHVIARSGLVQEVLCARREYLMPSLLLGLYLTAGLSTGPVRDAIGHFLVDLAAENRTLRKKASLPVGRDALPSAERALEVSDHRLRDLFPKVSASLWVEPGEYRLNLARAARELIAADPELSARLDDGLTRHLHRRQGGLAQLPPGSASSPSHPDSRSKRVSTGDASRASVPASPSSLPAPSEPRERSALVFLAAQARQILLFAENGYGIADREWREQVAAWMRECSW